MPFSKTGYVGWRQGPKEPGGKQSSGVVLCFYGGSAAAAARSARPLDLRAVAARIDAGAHYQTG